MCPRVATLIKDSQWNMSTEAVLRMSKQEVHTASGGLFAGNRKSIGQGAIVNISSGAGIRGHPELAAYCASKHGVHGVTRAMAKDWPHIRMNAVAPGMNNFRRSENLTGADGDGLGVIETPILANTPEVAARTLAKIPSGRMGQPEDVADTIIFLLSDASAWMTGQILSINGGSD